MDNNWYLIANQFDLKDYLTSKYGMEFKKNFCFCPFHNDDKTRNLSVKNGKNGWFFQCFSCGVAGDIAKFVELKEGLQPKEAIRVVLKDHGKEVDEIAIDKESQKIREENQKKLLADVSKKRVLREKEELLNYKKAAKKMGEDAVKFSIALHDGIENENEKIINELRDIVPGVWSSSFDNAIVDNAIGYDHHHQSIVIINRTLDGKTFNIKHRLKWEWDEKTKKHLEIRKDGKWISAFNSTYHPFGANFLNVNDNRVVICEGEKDALNLMSFGINAVTMGGTSSVGRWNEFLYLLQNRDVYIWFDNDRAGYSASCQTYKILEDKCKSLQIILFFKIGNFPKKYDISDFLESCPDSSKENIFHKIAYSCFSLSNQLIDETVEYLGFGLIDNDIKKLEVEFAKYKNKLKVLEFSDIKDKILSNSRSIKGERDAEIKHIQELQKFLTKESISEDLGKLINSLFKEKEGVLDENIKALRKVVDFKKSFFDSYRQVHIIDVILELQRATKSAGFSFAKYKDGLFIWTGMYYYYLQAWEIEDFIIQQFFRAAKMDWKRHTKRTMIEVIQDLAAHSVSLERWIDPEKRVVNMLNGTLIIRSSGKWIFKSVADKKDCALNVLPVVYNKNAKAPKWQKFLDRVLPDPKDQMALMEFVGYCFLPSHRFEKFLLLYGSTGANGKSVILDVISDFFGRENVTSLPLHSFEGHQLDSLNGKILNTGSEIESGGDLRKQFAALKTLTSSRESLTINPKNNPTYELYPEQKPKMAFATNKMVKSGADDGGVQRRMLVFVFDKEIADDEKIRDLAERLEDEKAGILNMALEGLERLIKNGTFTMSQGREKFMEEFKDDINPVRAYKNECLNFDAKGKMVAKKFVYHHYLAWCEDKGHNKPFADRTFWGKLKELTPSIDFYQPKNSLHDLLTPGTRFVKNMEIVVESLPSFNVGKENINTKDINFRHSEGIFVSYE